jgi:hypothetical protein
MSPVPGRLPRSLLRAGFVLASACGDGMSQLADAVLCGRVGADARRFVAGARVPAWPERCVPRGSAVEVSAAWPLRVPAGLLLSRPPGSRLMLAEDVSSWLRPAAAATSQA